MGTGRTALVVAIVVWAATGVAAGAVANDEGGSDAYNAGSMFGTAFATLIVAAIIRLAYVHLTPWGRGKPQVAPALFYLAAAIAAIFILATVGREASDEDAAVASAEDCLAAEPSPFDAAPPGVELGELAPAQRSRLEASFAAGLSAEMVEQIDARTISQNGRRVGFALAIPGMPESEFGEFEAGFIDSVGEQGGTVEDATISGQDVIVGETAASTVIAGLHGCYALALGAVDRATTEDLAAALFAG
jgi:hypothetical protein